MKYTTVVCDRCKRPIETSMVLLEIVATSDPAMTCGNVDLCGACAASLRTWLREPGGNETVEASGRFGRVPQNTSRCDAQRSD